jgi:adenylate cyclase
MVPAYQSREASVPAAPAPRPSATVIDLNARRRPCHSPEARGACAKRAQSGGLGLFTDETQFDLPACAPAAALWAEQRRRREIQRAFGQYVSPAVVERLVAHPELLSLGGETRELTVLFADIRGFTAISERLKDDPQRLNQVINAVLGPLSDIVMDHGGTIDKYIGDSVMAFWGAPLADPDHARNAVAAAQAMLVAMDGINASLDAAFCDERALPPIRIGIGVNTGDCVVGNIGSQRHFNYSALGDPVNVASRLVGLSKVYGVSLLIGESTASLLPAELTPREVDRIAVRGRVGPQALFTLPEPGVVTPGWAALGGAARARH